MPFDWTVLQWQITVDDGNGAADLQEVRLVVDDADSAESASDRGTLSFTRTGPAADPLTVLYSLQGDAVNGDDYERLPGSVTIPPGAASAPLLITPIDDGTFEGTESVIVALLPSTDYAAVPPLLALVQIFDDDGASVTLVASDPSASEGGDAGTFTIRRTGGNLNAPLLVQVNRGGTAISGRDYVALGGANFFVTIPANALSATVTITAIADAIAEAPETVTLAINPNAAYVIGTPAQATVTIYSP
jgi:hypothetical protein